MKQCLISFFSTVKTLLLLLVCFYSLKGFAQGSSEYYRSPLDTTLYSQSLAQARNLTVILPTTFNVIRKTKYPLLIVFDRQNRGIFRQMVESIDYLTRFDAMPEAIIIGVTSGQQRTLETSLRSKNGKATGEELIRFVFEELMPWCEKTYNTGKCRNLIGHSRFGYFTTVMMSRQAQQLISVISLSPFYRQGQANWVDSVTTRFAPGKPLVHKLFYRFITGDSLSDSPDYARMQAALRMAPLHPNFDWDAHAFYKASHNLVPGLGVMPSLLDIFHDWSAWATTFSPYSPKAASASYEDFKKRMRNVYGEEIGLGIARFNGLGNEYYNGKKYDKALFFWKELLADYPFFTPVYLAVADTYLALNQPKQAARYLQQGLQSLRSNAFLPASSQKELAKKIQQKLTELR
jgi:hypothetical protein